MSNYYFLKKQILEVLGHEFEIQDGNFVMVYRSEQGDVRRLVAVKKIDNCTWKSVHNALVAAMNTIYPYDIRESGFSILLFESSFPGRSYQFTYSNFNDGKLYHFVTNGGIWATDKEAGLAVIKVWLHLKQQGNQ